MCYVYIMTNRSKTLYTGITNSLRQRVLEHKNGYYEGFTSKYKCDRLVYYGQFSSIHRAIARRKADQGCAAH